MDRPILFNGINRIELRTIPGLDQAKYSAGSDGHIYCFSRSNPNRSKPSPFQLAESIGSSGYPFVAIIESGRRRSKAVHSLICTAFHGPRPSSRHETRHLDGSRDNNTPPNLAWGTPAENEADKRRHGTAAIGERHGVSKLNDEAVRILRVAIPAGLWNPVDAAQVFGCDPSVIRAAVARKSWRHIV
jgi:hypothetical protein